MSIAQALEGMDLPGRKRPGTWKVLEKLSYARQGSAVNCSVGYRVVHSDGTAGFLKASDLDLMTLDTGDMLGRLVAASEMQKFERTILDHCQGNNMDRVVTPLDYGDKLHVHEGQKEPLFWIVFELAKHDARVQMDSNKRLDFFWCVTAMHNLATAVQQLHTAKVSHNDIKPSNLLVFDDLLQKLGDLGSATSPDYPTLHDIQERIGDSRYAAPETTYANVEPAQGVRIDFDRRKASDLYLLGSMGFFFMTGAMMTPAVLSNFLDLHRPENWGGSFDAILPYWRHSFSTVIGDLNRTLPTDQLGKPTSAAQRFAQAIVELCEPDPLLRGHPLARTGVADRYSVERYIALFDLLRKASLH